jgi:hypothetical protein
MPQYILLLHDNPAAFATLSPEDMQKVVEKYMAWGARMRQAGVLRDGKKLVDDHGKVLRKSGTHVRLTDGPYSETKEILGGFYMVDANSYDHVAEIVQDSPHFEYGGTIEVREIDQMKGGPPARS